MRSIRIKAPENGLTTGTQIFDAETGTNIHGARELHVHFELDDVIRADVTLLQVTFADDVRAVARFHVAAPATGEPKPVRRIEFADGTTFEADDGTVDVTDLADGSRRYVATK